MRGGLRRKHFFSELRTAEAGKFSCPLRPVAASN